jgi:hypothetical protein
MAVRHRDAARPVTRALAAVAPALWLAAACSPTPALHAYWTGTDTGKAVLPARAALCGARGPLIILAQSGDTGIGLAIYASESLAAGQYPIFDPTQGKLRRGAALAARWTRKLVMADLRGVQGQVTLDGVRPSLAGHFSGRTAGAVTSASVAIEGSFKAIPVVTGGADCVGQSR